MKKTRIFLLLLFIFIFAFGSGMFVFSSELNALMQKIGPIGLIPDRPFRLGLDLQGGAHLVYEADLQQISSKDYGEAMQGLRDVIERRINLFGIQEPIVQVQQSGESWRLSVELAGIKDIKQAIEMIGQTPFLEFRRPLSQEQTEAILREKEEVKRKFEKGETLSQEEVQIAFQDPYFEPTPLTGRYLKKATLGFHDVTQEPLVLLEFNEDGTKLFAELTKQYVSRPLAIYLDGQLISAPTVQEEITSGQAQISGKFSVEEARNLVRNLNSGALPIPIKLISQQTVEATLGADSLASIMRAGMWGVLAVVFFMIAVYRVSGIFAVVSLGVYGIVLLALFKGIPITLTLSGIAGVILSLGMAVDANILIAERMREERMWGRDFYGMIREGFTRAWPSIRDGHVTTLISCIVLFFVGTGFIQGFALALGIGVILSMFAAIIISRLLFSLFIGTRLGKVGWPWTR